MINAKPLPIIFTNAITERVFNASMEARTKNRDILLITYHGNINESCSEFFSYISALRDFVPVDANEADGSEESSSASNVGGEKRFKDCDSDVLFRHRARDIIQSTTFIFIGRSNRKELLQFQNDMLHLNPQNRGEKNILTEALSFLFPNDNGKKKNKDNRSEANDEDHLWFRLVRDANALICNRLGATLPPSWWGEDPLIIPKICLVSANGGLNEIYVGKTDNRRNDGFHFGIGRRVQNGMFPCHTILEQLIEERIRRAKMVYKWCLYAQQEFVLIEKTQLKGKSKGEKQIFSYAVPTDIMSHIFEFLDHRKDLLQMELVSKSALVVTQEILVHRLRRLLNNLESIFPQGLDEDMLSDVEEDERISAFEKIVRELINTKSTSTPDTSFYSLSNRTTSLDSMRTDTSFSSSCFSDISECIDDLDRSSLSYSSRNYQEAELWMGWRCHMLTSVCTANMLLNRFQLSIGKKNKLKPMDERIRNLKSIRQKMFAML